MSSDIDIDLLISLVHERPVLWDRTLEIYKDKNKSREGWKSVCSLLNPAFEEMSDNEQKNYGQQVTKKWWNVRDQYVKYKNRQKLANRSGAGASKVRKYIYHDALQFLEKCLQHAETASNLDAAHDEAAPEEELIPDGSENPATPTDPAPSETQPRKTPVPPTKQTGPGKITARPGKKKPMDEFEIKMLKVLETPEPAADRHLMFFKGIIPSLSTFNDNQILDFQMGVLKLVKDIKNQGNQAQQPQIVTHHDPYPQPQPTYMFPYGTSTHPPLLRATGGPSQQPGPLYVDLTQLQPRKQMDPTELQPRNQMDPTQLQQNKQMDDSTDTTLYSPFSDESNVF